MDEKKWDNVEPVSPAEFAEALEEMGIWRHDDYSITFHKDGTVTETRNGVTQTHECDCWLWNRTYTSGPRKACVKCVEKPEEE